MATHNGAGGTNGKAPGEILTFGEMVYDWNAIDALAPAVQKLFAGRMHATTTVVEGGHDTLIAFPKPVAAAIEAASHAKQ